MTHDIPWPPSSFGHYWITGGNFHDSMDFKSMEGVEDVAPGDLLRLAEHEHDQPTGREITFVIYLVDRDDDGYQQLHGYHLSRLPQQVTAQVPPLPAASRLSLAKENEAVVMSTNTTRTWYTSRYERNTELYVEEVRHLSADGMPRHEFRILATVTPSGYKWTAYLWPVSDAPGIALASHYAKEVAMQAIQDHYDQSQPHDELS